MEKPNFDHPLSVTAEEIWQMEETREFPIDIESHYKGLLNMMDVLYYRNGNSFYPEIKTRHAAYFLALAMPSFAIIDPCRTREMKYNLHVASLVIESDNLSKQLAVYDAPSIRRLEVFVILALYKLVSEKTMNDERFHAYAEEVYGRIVENGRSAQNVFAYDTIEGTYEAYPNLAALLAFRIHDRCFGTDYCGCIEDTLLTFIREKLLDEETGLFLEFYKTGSLGIKGEHLSRSASWSGREQTAACNALAIAFMNYFDEAASERAWKAFKEKFTDQQLHVTAEELQDAETSSYVSQLTPIAQGLYGSLLAAKEMGDRDYFEKLQRHILTVAEPDQREGKIFFDALGNEQKLHGDFLTVARVHVGWKKILEHNWEDYYDFDYDKVR